MIKDNSGLEATRTVPEDGLESNHQTVVISSGVWMLSLSQQLP